MTNYRKLIRFLIKELKKKKLFKSITKQKFFHDEPKLFFYSTKLNSPSNSSGDNNQITGVKLSIQSKYLALLKCLTEAMERFCLYDFDRNSIVFSKYKDLKKEALDLSVYNTKNKSIKKEKFGWIKGFNLTKETSCLIPAQLVYINYHQQFKKETPLSNFNSTGAAGGFDHEATLLRGIYEVVERDAFLTCYLNKIKPEKINIKSIRSNLIQFVFDKCQRYKLDLFLFNITNDLEIPVFLSLVIDRTGLGPAVSVGLKSDLIVKEAIIGSIEEALMGRIFARIQMVKKKTNTIEIDPSLITTQGQRALFWSSPKMIKKLDFLLNQQEQPFRVKNVKYSNREKISIIKESFLKKGFSIYYTDITSDVFKNLGYLVYKIIIPDLQFLYLNEKHQKIKRKRLLSVSKYFNQKQQIVNKVPHPFL